MIFKKLLKGTELEFDVRLEKTDYRPGETVRGLLTLNTEKSSIARQLRLLVEGKESTAISVESHSSSSSDRWDSHTYNEVNTFFSEDLSHLLQKSVSSNTLEDGTLEILPQTKEISVEFTLPSDINLYSSYKGMHANITYTLKVTADIAKKLDVNKEEQFFVINPNNARVELYHIDSDSDTSTSEGDDKSNTITATTESENDNNSFASTSMAEGMSDNNATKESYSTRFDRIFGRKTDHTTEKRGRYPRFHGMKINYDLGTLLTKGREKFLKENSEAKVELLGQGNNNNNSTVFSPGQTLRGKAIALPLQNLGEENRKKNVRGMKVTLSGIEHAFAQGFQRVSTIEKYENKIEINGNRENDHGIPFEFQIPNGINQSYMGRYSEYFWGLEAKINIAWSSDIIARTIIEII